MSGQLEQQVIASHAAGCSSVSLFINQLSNLATTNGTRCASQQGEVRGWRYPPQ